MLTIGTHLDAPAQSVPPSLSGGRRVCIFARQRHVELAFPAMSLLYGMKPPLPFVLAGYILICCPTDLLTFLVIVYVSLRSNMWQFKLPSLFRTMAQDATRYFLVVFASHLALELALLFGKARIILYSLLLVH